MFRILDYEHCVSQRPRGHGKMDRFKHLWMVESFVSNVRAVSFAYMLFCPVAFLANASLPRLIHRSMHDTWSHQSRIIATRGTYTGVYYEMKCTLHKWVAIQGFSLDCVLDTMHDLKTLRVPSTLGCTSFARPISWNPRGDPPQTVVSRDLPQRRLSTSTDVS